MKIPVWKHSWSAPLKGQIRRQKSQLCCGLLQEWSGTLPRSFSSAKESMGQQGACTAQATLCLSTCPKNNRLTARGVKGNVGHWSGTGPVGSRGWTSLQDPPWRGRLQCADSHTDMKQGSCQKFRRKFDRIRGRGSNVDSAIIPGLRPSIWTSSCRRPERAMIAAGPSTRPGGPRMHREMLSHGSNPDEGASDEVTFHSLSLTSTFSNLAFNLSGCPSRCFP